MNTYVQDEIIPIYITLSYEKNTLKFPINPEKLPKEIESASVTEDVEGIGQISVPQSPRLAKMTIESFFWQAVNLLPSSAYIKWLERWQRSRKPANLIVTRLNYSMTVTCESFRHWIGAGEERDVYFELSLQEYRPYGARRLASPSNETLLQRYKEALDSATLPVLFEIPRPVRGTTMKEAVSNTFSAVSGCTTLCAITKRLTGRELYEANKERLGDILGDWGEIPGGEVLTVPDAWVS